MRRGEKGNASAVLLDCVEEWISEREVVVYGDRQ